MTLPDDFVLEDFVPEDEDAVKEGHCFRTMVKPKLPANPDDFCKIKARIHQKEEMLFSNGKGNGILTWNTTLALGPICIPKITLISYFSTRKLAKKQNVTVDERYVPIENVKEYVFWISLIAIRVINGKELMQDHDAEVYWKEQSEWGYPAWLGYLFPI